jgi:DNA-binding NtrC family response regulator
VIDAPTVLLVEDDELVRLALAFPLEDAGMNVVAVDDADAAIEVLKSDNNIRAVISDVRMPGSIDGLGLAKWLKEHKPKLPVVLTSGYLFASKLAAVNPAIAIIVKKPYDVDDVTGWVKSLVDSPVG